MRNNRLVMGALWAAALPIAAATAPVAGAQESVQVDPKETYVHERSGMRFPGRIGDFIRTRVTAYDLAATDVSVGYDLAAPDSPIAMTVYIYPAPEVPAPERERACASIFEDTKLSIVNAYPGAELLNDGSAPPVGGQRMAGRQAVYGFDGNFRGERQRLRSELDLYCYVGGEWLIKYRVSHPADEERSDEIADFMERLTWPVAPDEMAGAAVARPGAD